MKARGLYFNIVVILLLFITFDIKLSESFNLQSSTILEKQANVLGVELNYALLDLEFDRDLYRYKSVSCANFQCEKDPIDCTCDYTDRDNCGKTVSGSSQCKECPTEINISTDPTNPKYLYYCDLEEEWEVVEANKQYKFTISDTGIMNIRYKANSNICEGMRLYVSPDQGAITMNISPYPYFTYFGRNSPSTDPSYEIELNVCPTDNQDFLFASQWTNSTYFIKIFAQTPVAEFTFEIMSAVVPDAEIEDTCEEVLASHQCIVDGSIVNGWGDDEEIHYYTYAVTEPQIVAFSLPSLQEDIDFFMSDDPTQTMPDSFSKAKWDCSNERDDYLTLKMEPLPNGDPLILYIGVSTFYKSNYTFTITTQGTNVLHSITDGSPQAETFSLVQSSRLILPSGESKICNVWSRCNPFSIVYPFTQNLPIWPLPSILLGDKRFFGITFQDNYNLPQKNHYKAAFLLSSRQGNTKTVNNNLDTIAQSKIEFLNRIVDSDGNLLKGSFGFTLKNLTCDYQGFLNVTERLNQEEDTLFSTTNFVKLNSVVFKINTLTMTDEWVSCSNQASSLLSTNTSMLEKMTTFCPYSSTDPNFELDPCCNSSLSFFHCCVPRLLSVEESVFNGVRDDLISNQCSSPDCTVSVLDDYQTSLSTSQDCDVPGFLPDQTNIEMKAVLRQCKSVLVSQQCNSDSDCSSGVTCDLFSRLCLTPAEAQDKAYLKCVFDNLPKPYVFSIIYKHNLNETAMTAGGNFIDNVFNAFKHEDCSYFTGQQYRTYYQYYSEFAEKDRCYPYPNCLDLSCETVHDVCYDGNYGGWITSAVTYKDICETDIGFCNVASCDVDFTVDQCKSQCESIPDFCGYCSTDITDCFASNDITTEVDCNDPDTYLCLFDNGVSDSNLNKTQCESSGYCDKPCGYKCGGFTPSCVAKEIYDEDTCDSYGYNWEPSTFVCIQPTATTKQKCSVLNVPDITFVWTNCSIYDFDTCFSQGLDGWNVCSIEEIPCLTKEDCENSGECSDQYFFNQEIVSFYPEKHGKCVRGHYIWKSHWTIPTCDIDLEKDSPLGCYPYYFTSLDAPAYVLDYLTVNDAPLSEESCLAQGEEFRWWTPAQNQDQCLSKKGCKILDGNYFNLPYNFRFNQMTEDQCGSCGLDVFASWENMFTWSSGTWYPGVYVKPTWMSPKFVYSTTFQNLTNYQYLFQELDDSVKTHIADLYRSESLCKMERIEDNLKSISCACSGDGGTSCFTTSALVLGESKPCQGEESSYSFNNGIIYFTGNSVVFSCTSALISQISKQLYKSTIPQSLSSSFVSYRKPDNYGVLNSKDAIIGTILSDGIRVSSQGLQSLTLCFVETDSFSEESKTYPVLDFALEDQTTTSLVPMELDIYSLSETTNNTTQGKEIKYICGNITVSDSSISIFPIHRFEEWEDVNKEVFDKAARGLLYTLAVFFLLTSLWGIYQLVVVLYRRKTLGEKIKLVHLLILFVTIFITIRAIYFFILPSGGLSDNAVGDYILVVLPTFVYFTSFTIIIVLWYIIIKTRSKARNLLKQVTFVVIIINIILYLLFMIIVLVFHFTESDPKDDCGGRIIVAVSNTTPQRVVSIFYAVIQAVISLVIGAAFIYLGGSLYLAMRFKKVSETSASSDHHQKIFIITFACSIGFILHCVFVLILVGAEPSNVVFSFLGLIITEILPSLSIFYSYNQGNLTGIKQTTDVSNLQYVSNHETFHSTKGSVTNSTYLNSSTSIDSTRFSSSSNR